jgi:hypothetical protein
MEKTGNAGRKKSGRFSVALILLGALAVAGPAVAASEPPGLVSYWSFEEGGGSTAIDSAGGNTGSIMGAVYSSDAAPVPNTSHSLAFDGVDDSVDVPDAPTLDFGPLDSVTISLWVKKTSNPAVYHILGKREGCGTMNYQLARDGGGVHFNSANAGPGRVNTSVDDLPNGIWTHVAATYDGSSLKMYIGGIEVGSASPFALGVPNDAPLRIGASGTCGNNFPGLIDEVRFYSPALSAQDVAALARGRLIEPPGTKDQCKNGGWELFAHPEFKNQGQCVRFVEHG